MDLESLTRLIYDGLGDSYHLGNFSHAVARFEGTMRAAPLILLFGHGKRLTTP